MLYRSCFSDCPHAARFELVSYDRFELFVAPVAFALCTLLELVAVCALVELLDAIFAIAHRPPVKSGRLHLFSLIVHSSIITLLSIGTTHLR